MPAAAALLMAAAPGAGPGRRHLAVPRSPGPWAAAPARAAALLLACASAALPDPPAAAPPARFVFVGDVLLTRGVAKERNERRVSPWRGWEAYLKGADWAMGNLEGAVGPASACVPGPDPCFAVPDSLLKDAREAGFTAMSVANNHSGDLGPEGYRRTQAALTAHGLVPVGFEDSPVFREAGGLRLAFVALSLVPGKDGRAQSLGLEAARKLRFARAFADRVIVFAHWGAELRDWPSEEQLAGARWLVRNGADLILGAHSHVAIPPACVDGAPVFHSLGNHLFDQKYPQTRRGLAADCAVDGRGIDCRAVPTSAAPDGFRPLPPDSASLASAVRLPCGPRVRSGPEGAAASASIVTEWREGAARLEWAMKARGGGAVRWSNPAPLYASPFAMDGEADPHLFALERHYSPIDRETGPRPYVYRIGPRGPSARWRGSALAWPLIDAAPAPGTAGALCALHRGDSFLAPDTSHPGRRTAAYRWNGFGFSMAREPELERKCREMWEGLPGQP